MSDNSSATTYAPGFYPDAQTPGQERYFDGRQWTDQVRPVQAVAVPGPPAKKPRNVVGLIALIVAVVGTVFACIPGALIVGWILLPIAFILGIVSLFLPRKARAMGIIGIVLSIVGTIIGFGVFFAVVSSAVDDAFRDDTVAVAPSDPDEDASADQPAAATAQDITVVDTGFGASSSGTYWYGIVIDNPNTDYVFNSAEVTVEAVAADGTILDSSSSYVTLLQGRSILTGTFFDIGAGTIDRLEVRGPTASAATSSAATETGTLTIDGISPSTEYSMTTVTGRVTSTFSSDQSLVEVNVIARDANGAMVGATMTFIDRLPADGAAQFEATFFDLQNAASFDVTAVL